MPRSSTPLALSVVSMTEPGDIQKTFERITEFDNRQFGFNHNQTWTAMPLALKGVLKADRVAGTFSKAPKRVQDCIVALCRLGEENPLQTFKFKDFPAAGIRTRQSIEWDPTVTIRVMGSCWYVADETAIIPLLQPRKAPLSELRLAVYQYLATKAYCNGDWSAAQTALIDLSGDGPVTARYIDLHSLPQVSERDVREFVETFVQAKQMADQARRLREKPLTPLPMGELLDI